MKTSSCWTVGRRGRDFRLDEQPVDEPHRCRERERAEVLEDRGFARSLPGLFLDPSHQSRHLPLASLLAPAASRSRAAASRRPRHPGRRRPLSSWRRSSGSASRRFIARISGASPIAARPTGPPASLRGCPHCESPTVPTSPGRSPEPGQSVGSVWYSAGSHAPEAYLAGACRNREWPAQPGRRLPPSGPEEQSRQPRDVRGGHRGSRVFSISTARGCMRRSPLPGRPNWVRRGFRRRRNRWLDEKRPTPSVASQAPTDRTSA